MNIQKAIENGPVEIVDFPMKNGGSFHCYVSSPEGKWMFIANLHNLYAVQVVFGIYLWVYAIMEYRFWKPM